MPGKDRIIDPVTRDYVKNDSGGYAKTDTIGTQVFEHLVIRKNQWCGDANAGSNLHQFKHYGAGQTGIDFVVNECRTALAKFERQGLARDIRVEAEIQDGRICATVSVIDIHGAEVIVEGIEV